MGFWQPLAEMWRGLREQRARTIMTLMGLAWGTFAVIVLLAFGTGLQRMLQEKLANLGRGIAVVWSQQTTKSYEGMGKGRSIKLKAADVAALPGQIRELDLISPEYISGERVEMGSRVHRATIAGVYPDYAELRSWQIQRGGRFINDRDMTEKRRVVVLGDGIKAALLGPGDAVGQRVMFRGLPFTVIGVMRPKDQDSDYDGRDERRVCLPAATFEQVFGNRYISDFVYRARSMESHARVTDQIYRILGRIYKFDPADRLALNIWDTNETERVRHYVFLGFNLMLGGSGALTLLVGGVGVGNLMFIRVRQRAHEIAIQMALGAKPRRILIGVLSEALLLSATGGAIGFVMSWLATWIVTMTPLARDIGHPVVSWPISLITVGLLGTVGLLAGYFPARRAARLDPARVLADMGT